MWLTTLIVTSPSRHNSTRYHWAASGGMRAKQGQQGGAAGGVRQQSPWPRYPHTQDARELGGVKCPRHGSNQKKQRTEHDNSSSKQHITYIHVRVDLRNERYLTRYPHVHKTHNSTKRQPIANGTAAQAIVVLRGKSGNERTGDTAGKDSCTVHKSDSRTAGHSGRMQSRGNEMLGVAARTSTPNIRKNSGSNKHTKYTNSGPFGESLRYVVDSCYRAARFSVFAQQKIFWLRER